MEWSYFDLLAENAYLDLWAKSVQNILKKKNKNGLQILSNVLIFKVSLAETNSVLKRFSTGQNYCKYNHI